MNIKPLDLSGEGTATNEELNYAVVKIYNILRSFKSPKDAAVVLAFVHASFMNASFAPEYRAEAIAALDQHIKIVKELLAGGLN